VSSQLQPLGGIRVWFLQIIFYRLVPFWRGFHEKGSNRYGRCDRVYWISFRG
jgi:hypothetical protein